MNSEFDLNAKELDAVLEDGVKAGLSSVMQRIKDRATKFKVDDVPKDLAVTGSHDGLAC